MEKIATGVAGHTQFREDRKLYPFPVKLPEHIDYRFGVGPDIRHPDGGYAGRHSEKTVAHIFILM